MDERTTVAVTAIVIAGVAVLGVLVGTAPAPVETDPGTTPGTDSGTDPNTNTGIDSGPASGIEPFDGPGAFESYVETGRSLSFERGAVAAMGRPTTTVAAADSADGGDGGGTGAEGATRAAPLAGDAATGTADVRVGTTNVQESSVDEPDLVKTDGRYFYVAPRWSGRGGIRAKRSGATTHVIDTATPADPRRVAAINASGRLLVVGDTLVVHQHDRIVGYDVSTPADPTREWSRELNGSLVSARAIDGRVYLVVAADVERSPRCPVEPLEGTSVACGDLYHPAEQVPVDAVYTVLSLDPVDGTATDAVGFVGTRRDTTVYASTDAIYVTYTDPMDRSEMVVSALLASEAVPADVKERLREVRSYDLSREATMAEVRHTYREWLQSLPKSERKERRTSVEADVTAYARNNSRSFTTTGIVRVGVDGAGLSVGAHGTVPGRPLNQFSLDEYDGRLRIATTVPGVEGDSANDLYTLDATSLERIGSIQGMAPGQEIFAVRYVGERAYLVTFRRVDPFHVVDLSDPAEPVELGVKKLPGFSRYLHPVDENHVLGIGKEDGRVKAVLFDVSDPANPTIADSAVYDREWSAVSRTHHAFTIDRRHGVFFLPAGNAGLVVDYTNESLAVETTVRVDGAMRARYVGDYLYVFGREAVAVLDEGTWNVTARLRYGTQSAS